jgi:hypothetical protein
VGVDGPLVFDDEDMVIDAAVASLGLAYAIEDQVAAQLQVGTLARVLDASRHPVTYVARDGLRAFGILRVHARSTTNCEAAGI